MRTRTCLLSMSAPALLLFALCAGGCDPNFKDLPGGGEDHAGYDDNHNGNCDGGVAVHLDGGTIPSTDGGNKPDGGTTKPDERHVECGTPTAGYFYVGVKSDMTGRQEVLILRGGSDIEERRQVEANKPICVLVKTGAKLATRIGVVLVCKAGDPCPDYTKQAPILTVGTTPKTEIRFYFDGWSGVSLNEMPPFGSHFDWQSGVFYYQYAHLLITTGEY